MPKEIKITHVVFNEKAIKFATFFVDENDVDIGKIELTYFNEKAIEPYTRCDTLILGPVLKKLA